MKVKIKFVPFFHLIDFIFLGCLNVKKKRDKQEEVIFSGGKNGEYLNYIKVWILCRQSNKNRSHSGKVSRYECIKVRHMTS